MSMRYKNCITYGMMKMHRTPMSLCPGVTDISDTFCINCEFWARNALKKELEDEESEEEE